MLTRINCNFIFILVLISLLTSCNATETDDGGSSVSQQGLEALWSSNDFPLNISVSNQLSADETVATSSSLDEWDNALASESFFSGALASVSDPKHANLEDYRDTVLGVYAINSADPLTDPSIDGQTKALAITQFYATIENGASSQYYRIIHADIFINKRHYDFSTESDQTKYDFSSVIVHELGHLLGLGHTDFGQESVMNPSISQSTEKKLLFPVDEDSIYNLYQASASASRASLLANKVAPSNQEVVRVVTKLMPDGSCEHFQDDVLTGVHHH